MPRKTEALVVEPHTSAQDREGGVSKTAAQAIDDFEASKTLARARQAVELAVAKHKVEQHVKDATRKALKEAEQGWQRAIDKIAERASLTKGHVTRR